MSFTYKKNSKKKTRHVKVDLKNNGDVYNNANISDNGFAPVVLAGEKPETVTQKPPTTIYAHVEKSDTTLPKKSGKPKKLPKSANDTLPTSVNTTLPKSDVSDVQYFDPNEFDVETTTSENEQPPATLKSTYTNSTYDYQEDEDIDNKPSFLI